MDGWTDERIGGWTKGSKCVKVMVTRRRIILWVSGFMEEKGRRLCDR
jgi:hypothetical protein